MKRLLLVLPILFLAGCASAPPTGPGVMVLPGSGKSFETFRFDDHECRQFASTQTGTTAAQAQDDSGLKGAAAGAAIGAIAGAAITRSGHGMVAGAGLGTAGGAMAGGASGTYNARTVQQRYDNGYQQCMYAKGHKIPMAERYERHISRPAATPPARPSYSPPPPPGTPPPPPPAS